jgi:putative nucleic acid binding protein
MIKRLFLYSLVGLVVFAIVIALRGRAPADVSVERAEPTVGDDGVISVGSIRLWQDYDANEVAADNQYKGKSLRVTGRILSIEKNLMGAARLDLASGNPVFRVIATIDSVDTPRAAVLAKGDTVLVQCTGAGSFMRMPQLDRCALLRPE